MLCSPSGLILFIHSTFKYILIPMPVAVRRQACTLMCDLGLKLAVSYNAGKGCGEMLRRYEGQ